MRITLAKHIHSNPLQIERIYRIFEASKIIWFIHYNP